VEGKGSYRHGYPEGGRIGIASQALGIAEGAFERGPGLFQKYSKQSIFGKQSAQDEMILTPITLAVFNLINSLDKFKKRRL